LIDAMLQTGTLSIRLARLAPPGAVFLIAAVGLLGGLKADEFRVAPVEQAADSTVLAPPIAQRLASQGWEVVVGDGRVHCRWWLARTWPLGGGPTGPDVLYPFTPGEVLGVVHFPRKASDFREQDIPAGWYVARYAQQPVDGAHVGTSPTRDFVVLCPAAKDRDPAPPDYQGLVALGKQTSGTEHPAILSLQRAEAASEPASLREDAERGWVILQLRGQGVVDGQSKELPLAIVVVGKVAE
jgi:hypothetical protein